MTQLRDRIAHVADQIRTQMDMHVLEAGWELFRRFAIVSLQPEDNSFLKADVRDKRAYEVLLHTEQADQSMCTCGEGPLCRHVAAAFFQAYNLYGHHPGNFLTSCQQYHEAANEEATLFAPALAVPELTVKSARSMKKWKDTISPPQPAQSPSEWHDFFQANFDFKEDIIDTPVLRTALAYYEYAQSDAWEPTLRQLYQLHVLCFILLGMERNSQANHSDWSLLRMQWKIDDQYIALLEEFERLLDSLHAEEAISAYPDVVEPFIHYPIESEGHIEQASIDWLSIYQLLWQYLLLPTEWREAELMRIENALPAANPGSKTYKYLHSIAAWHEVLQGRSQAAMKRLQAHVKQDKLIYYWRILFLLAEQKEWTSMLQWIYYLMPLMERATRSDWAVFMKAWEHGVEKQTDPSDWHQIMISYLHLTYWYYCDYLLKKGMYDTWVDIHLYREISPAEINKDMLRQLEQHDQHLLLPLYHQAIERSIALRNRDAYRDSVRMMKKLKHIYDSLLQQQDWERYLQYIVGTHSRLRALQEEIQKGKLL